ncbi:MAG: phosphotransferase family protein [Candidatus Binatia bacterium]
MSDPSREGATEPERVVAALPAWLSGRWPAAEGLAISDLSTPLGTGNSNETIFFRATWRERGEPRAGRYVLRIEPRDPPLWPRQTAAPVPSVEVQYRAMQAVGAHGTVPLAPLIGYEPRPDPLGRPFFVMGHVNGRVPTDWPPYTREGFLADEASPAQRRRLFENGIEVMAALHRIDWRTADLGWLVPPERAPGLRWQLDLHRAYARSGLHGRAHPILEQAFDWLEVHFPGEGELAISWGDAKISNLIFSDDACVAVTDWESVAIGPPELDLGWWLMFDRFMHESSGATRLDGIPTRAQQQEHYEAVSGRRVGNARYFEVFAAMRYATVLVRLGDRYAAAGRVPAEMNMAVDNVATQVLADLLGIAYCWTDPPR